MKTRTSILALFAFLTMAASVMGQSLITNGSLTGPTGPANIPSGWTATSGSVDTSFADGSNTLLGLYWDFAPSSDGGSFVHSIAGVVGGYREGFGQTISGLTIGQTYGISFEQSITNYNVAGPFGADYFAGNQAVWEVTFGSASQYSAVMLMPSFSELGTNIWQSETLYFTATTTDQTLNFQGLSVARGATALDDRVDVLVDNIRITAALVPEPSGALLVGLTGTIALLRRRRLRID
jgi:hypothetical protein